MRRRSVVVHAEVEGMNYSVSQINNLLRTYPQQLKVKATLPEEGRSLSLSDASQDRVSISAEGKRLLEAVETQRPT